MSYLPQTVPGPKIDEVNAPFWDKCNSQHLCFQQCTDCQHLVHPPLPVCPACQSVNRTWKKAPLRGRVYSFTWVHTAAHNSVSESLPYNVVLIDFPQMLGVRLVSNVINALQNNLTIGDEVELIWECVEHDQKIPRFKKI